MLGPILQFIWQQIGPAIQQTFTFALPYLNRIPPHVYINTINSTSKGISDWYNSLDAKSRNRLDGAIEWAAKDLLSDAVFDYTGVQLKPLIDKAIELYGEHQENPKARAYIEDKLLLRTEKNKESQKQNIQKHSVPDDTDPEDKQAILKEKSDNNKSHNIKSSEKFGNEIKFTANDLLQDASFLHSAMQPKSPISKEIEIIVNRQENPEAIAHINDELVKIIKKNNQFKKPNN